MLETFFGVSKSMFPCLCRILGTVSFTCLVPFIMYQPIKIHTKPTKLLVFDNPHP